MAVTACAYGYDSGRRPPSPAQVMGSFDDDDDRGHHCPIFHDHCCIVHGFAMPPPPAPPPPPPPPPPPFSLHSGHASSKAAASRHPGLCTEGLGSESSESSGDLDLGGLADNIEDCKSQQQHSDDQEETAPRTRGSKRVFPPPISVIGAAGKPWQYLRAQRGGGRLVLREVRIPSRELLHACREDGRLKLHFAHSEEQHHI